MSPSELTVTRFDERRFEQESAAKTRELDLREREIAAKEREVAAKEKELDQSRWLNPTVIGLFAAALGLIGSVVVARVNNQNTQEVERVRSQSTLVLEAIKTGSPDAACKNLLFFVGLGLLSDADQTIHRQCASAPKGAPSLPSIVPRTVSSGVRVAVLDGKSGKPLAGAKVTMVAPTEHQEVDETDIDGVAIFQLYGTPLGAPIKLTAERAGYHPSQMDTVARSAISTPISILRLFR